MRSRPRGQAARSLGSGGEALTGVHAGQVSSPDIRNLGLPTLCPYAEGNIGRCAIASAVPKPTGSETLCMRGSFMRENREISWPLDGWSSESHGQGQGHNPMMYDHEKSDGPVVPANHRNKAPQGVADGGEERGSAKGNQRQQNTHRTQRRGCVPNALTLIRQARYSVVGVLARRHYPRQEPSAVVPPAGICAGGPGVALAPPGFLPQEQ